MSLTARRRALNRAGLLEVLGVPEDGSIVTPPGANPHRDVGGDVGFLEVGGELLEVDHDDLAELTVDVVPRPRRAPARRPGGVAYYRLLVESAEALGEDVEEMLAFLGEEPDLAWAAENADMLFSERVVEEAAGRLIEGEYDHPAFQDGSTVEQTPERRGAWAEFHARREAALGRSDAGAKGDVDLPDAEVGEAALVWEPLEEVAGRPSGMPRPCSPGSDLREGSSGSHDRARRLSESAERVCRCSEGDAEDRKSGCGGICAMAGRHVARRERAAGLRESEDVGVRDWAGDLL